MVKKRKSNHKRRDRYWLLYDLACARELSAVISELARLVDEAGDPWPKPKRGRPPVHSNRKMVVICVLTVMLGFSYRNMQSLLNMLKLPLKEPVPDHSTIHHAFKRVPEEYLKTLLEKSAQLCIAESGWTKGVVAPDSARAKFTLKNVDMQGVRGVTLKDLEEATRKGCMLARAWSRWDGAHALR